MIQKIIHEGHQPGIEIIKTELSETEAYELEESLILQHGRIGIEPYGILTNKMLGKNVWAGRVMSNKTKRKISERKKGKPSPLRGRKLGKKNWTTEDYDRRPQLYKTGLKPWNKGQAYTLGAINGKASAAKQSATVTGRKKKINPDGSWCWIPATESNGFTIHRSDGAEIVVNSLRQYCIKHNLDPAAANRARRKGVRYKPRKHPYSYMIIDNDLV